jgi:hypothetical protein
VVLDCAVRGLKEEDFGGPEFVAVIERHSRIRWPQPQQLHGACGASIPRVGSLLIGRSGNRGRQIGFGPEAHRNGKFHPSGPVA